ncbi:protein of unknown function [Candidatus Nitrosacidococcus tergens]|uniref:Uncharacterized protein n=1 Tax=Candidatus Nitrosacidococcus tergens TaxID=553981 RepID=A0A7G1QB10_9GAMM|nr:protein of unknown function [Candidatus Nitrosacidococcus tergens]
MQGCKTVKNPPLKIPVEYSIEGAILEVKHSKRLDSPKLSC